jgi:TPR repeat protein
LQRNTAYVLAGCITGLALLAGYSFWSTPMTEFPEISANIKKQLAFTCAHEKVRIPPRDPEAEQLYQHARWIRKTNILKRDPAVYPSVERLIRIATAYGHDKANIELRDLLKNGQAVSPDPVNEMVDLVESLIQRGIPSGYYAMGWHAAHGYGVRGDQELAFKYYRKSADLGSPEGQYLVGYKLADKVNNGEEIANIGLSMYRCAADQHHAKAALDLGVRLKIRGQYADATKYFQIGAQAGDDESAGRLSSAFSPEGNSHELHRLDQLVDPERQSRYKQIWKFLADYSYLNPTVPELNDIVPLPPAKLPPWDGKFKWVEAHEAAIPPPLPSEQRIAEMARAKGLDPKTGRPSRSSK